MSAEDSRPADEQSRRLWRLFIVGRTLVTGSMFLLVIALSAVLPLPRLLPMTIVTGVQFLSNGYYQYVWRRRELAVLGYLAFGIEILLISLLVYSLGQDGLVFLLAYLWPIIMGGMLIGRGAIAPLTLASGVAYGVLFALQHAGLLWQDPVLEASGSSIALVLSMPYLVALSLMVWLLVSEMEATQRALRVSNADLSRVNATLSGVLTHMGEAVVVAGADETVVLANQAAARLLDVGSRGELMPEWFQDQLGAYDAKEGPQRPRVVLEHNGRHLAVTSTTLEEGVAGAAHRVYLVRDATQDVEVDRVKSDFVAFVSHELRTPLATMKMLVTMLLADAPRDSKARDYLAVVQSQIDRQSHLVSNYLDLSKLEAGKYELPLETVHTPQVVENVLAVCRPLAAAKGVTIEAHCAQAPALFVSNAGGLEQVLINLLTNALKYSPGEERVAVSCARVGDEVVFTVDDAGPGIPAEQMGKLFTKFGAVRGDNGREGTGLGLVISDMIVRKLGGRIDVHSELGAGSSFAVRLPLRPAA